MNDIIERLRKYGGQSRAWQGELLIEAANEIERLRKQVEQERYDLRAVVEMSQSANSNKLDEIIERIKKLGI